MKKALFVIIAVLFFAGSRFRADVARVWDTADGYTQLETGDGNLYSLRGRDFVEGDIVTVIFWDGLKAGPEDREIIRVQRTGFNSR